jgi:hypothetical protein
MAIVVACPYCGRRVHRHCYHDGREVPSVEMVAERARELRVATYISLLSEAVDRIEEGDIPVDPENPFAVLLNHEEFVKGFEHWKDGAENRMRGGSKNNPYHQDGDERNAYLCWEAGWSWADWSLGLTSV